MDEQKPTGKRFCESKWHEPIQLKPFQECPRCKSESFHDFILDGKEEREDE